ncbi:Pyridoxal-phosphate dependent enzyme [Tenacibaculum sp. 190130A14a]|uniref:Threonine dehydratase n=1 Tax=Tenacibaculum polynesiense TaxID=3137857 RepID=A0ABP1EXK7_9FLAO
MINKIDIERTYKIISSGIIETPLIHSPLLSHISGANVYFKLENQQKTGSFKMRGVLSKINSLNKFDFNKLFVASSTGNHAAAFCEASEKFGFKGVLFLPENTASSKVSAIAHYKNVEKIFFGKNSVDAEMKATQYAYENKGILIHPYNDLKIIEGQGTIGIEIKHQLPQVDVILAPIGGGGLISGLCCYFKDTSHVKVIGCQAENASEMYRSVKLNSIVQPSIEKTIADAVAGGIEHDSLTFPIIKEHISGFEIISEINIKRAVAFIANHHQILIEPSAALPVAALLNNKTYKNKNVVLVVTGKKINMELLTEILNKYGNYYS